MNIFRRKQKADLAEIAKVLLNEFVDDQTFEERPSLQIDNDKEPFYSEKTRLYRLALVLMCLSAEKDNNPNFAVVSENLEALVFPTSDEKRLSVIADLSYAMVDLSNLLSPSENPKQMSWAMAWLAPLGIEESNFATLFIFGMKWQNRYLAIRESLQEIGKII